MTDSINLAKNIYVAKSDFFFERQNLLNIKSMSNVKNNMETQNITNSKFSYL